MLVACSSVSGGRLLTTNLGERLGSARRLLACCADSSGGVGRAGCDGVAASLGGIGAMPPSDGLGGIGAMGAENCRALPARLRGDAKAVAAAVAAAEGRCFRLRRGESGERKSSVVSLFTTILLALLERMQPRCQQYRDELPALRVALQRVELVLVQRRGSDGRNGHGRGRCRHRRRAADPSAQP